MINAEIGSSTANSYVDVAYADAFFATSISNASWPTLLASKEAALIEATRVIDSQFNWLGLIASETQSLRWPRIGAYDPDSRLIQPDTIPKAVMDATCNLAYFMIQNGGLVQSEKDLKSVKIGPIDLKFSDKVTIGVPRYIIKVLQFAGSYNGAVSGSAYSTSVIRS